MDKIIDVLSIIQHILICVTTLCTMSFVLNYKKQRSSATFGYWAQLMAYLVPILQEYRQLGRQFNERLLPISERREEPSPIMVQANSRRTDFSNNCHEMLNFLRNAKEQIPASEKWLMDLKTLLEFLSDMSAIKNESFYKYSERNEDEMNKYYNNNIRIMDNIVKEIENEQDDILNNSDFTSLIKNKIARIRKK